MKLGDLVINHMPGAGHGELGLVVEEEEYEGVDISDCGMEAYPEFTRGQ